VESVRERYTLIYGTETVYDHVEHDIIRVAHLRLALGKDPVNFWLYTPGRHMVTATAWFSIPADGARRPST
jgi:hypothetical protein